MAISGWWINKNTHKQLYLACVFYKEDGGRGYWMGVRDVVCIGIGRGVYMGLYYANLSFVQFRAMMLGIHVYVYIGYMVMDIQWVILYSMW